MLKRLYRCAVRLHPSCFRRRFGDEMLYIFDQRKGRLAALSLMLDSVFSLLRQWTLRPDIGVELPAAPLLSPTADHIPSFETLDTFCPRASAIINGTVLSLILFWLTAFAIRYCWIHVLNLSTREIAVVASQQDPSQTRPSHSAGSSTQPRTWDSKKSSERLQVDVIPTGPEDAQTKSIASSSPRTPAAPVRTRGVTLWLRLELYVGKYISTSPPAKISIRIEGDHLSLAAPGHPQLALSPVSPTRFVIVGAENDYVDFAPDDQGRICCLSLVESGNVINAQRQQPR
jgi:hypothetical protein